MADRKKVAEQKKVAGRGDRVRDGGGVEEGLGGAWVELVGGGSGSEGEEEVGMDGVLSGSEELGVGGIGKGSRHDGEKEISKDGSRDGDRDGDMDVDGEQDKDGDLMVEAQDLGEEDGTPEDGNAIDANFAGRSGSSPKRPRNDEETEPADEEANHADKRRKTHSIYVSDEGSPVEEPTASQPQDDDAGNEDNDPTEPDLLQGIRANWELYPNEFAREAPAHLLERAHKKDEQITLDLLRPLYNLSTSTKGQWRGENGVRAELANGLSHACVTRHGKAVLRQAINEVRDVFADRATSENGSGQNEYHPEQATAGLSGNPNAPLIVRNNNPTPMEIARRRQIVQLITNVWKETPQQVVHWKVRRNFEYPHDPHQWDMYALRRLWELGEYKAAFTYKEGLKTQLKEGYFLRIQGRGQTLELIADDSYYAYNGDGSWKPFKALELPAMPRLFGNSNLTVLNAHNTFPGGPLGVPRPGEPSRGRPPRGVTSDTRPVTPANGSGTGGAPLQPPNNGAAPPPTPQHNGSAPVHVQHPQPRRRTPPIQRQIVLAQHELRIAQHEQLVAEAGVEVAKARQSKTGMNHHPGGTAELNAAACAVTTAKGKVQEVKTRLIDLREKLDELHEKRDNGEKE